MSRPPLEVADLIRNAGAAFLERNRHWLSWKHVKVLRAIARYGFIEGASDHRACRRAFECAPPIKH